MRLQRHDKPLTRGRPSHVLPTRVVPRTRLVEHACVRAALVGDAASLVPLRFLPWCRHLCGPKRAEAALLRCGHLCLWPLTRFPCTRSHPRFYRLHSSPRVGCPAAPPHPRTYLHIALPLEVALSDTFSVRWRFSTGVSPCCCRL